jgi:hypothetical protein
MLKLAQQGALSNRGEDDVKGPHASGSKSTIDREVSGSETGQNRAETGIGPGRPAWPVSGPVRDTL